MAKTSYLIIPSGFNDQFFGAVASKDRFQYARVAHVNRLLSYKQRQKVKSRSLLPMIRDLWVLLNSTQKNAWKSAGLVCGLSGYALFVQDTTRRLQSEQSGVATPSTIHQSLCGEIVMNNYSDHIKLIQQHPNKYWVQRKVPGKQKVYEPVPITENFALPLQVGVSFKSNLVANGSLGFAKLYAAVRSNYQGRTLNTNVEINIPMSSAWNNASASIASVVGKPIGYDLYLELENVTGTLLFDNVICTHSGQNWTRDPFCNDIKQGFTRAFYQVAKHWAPAILTAGADYGSIYPTD